MLLDKLTSGKSCPEDIFAVIEISKGAKPVKYEMDKDTGALMVDRFLSTAMFYPANYGFIPRTLGDDGDPLDVLVLCPYPLLAGSVINARPIGHLKMEDEKGLDEKIIAVPVTKLHPPSESVKEVSDLPQEELQAIEHFFGHYKDLEKGKWVKLGGWASAQATKEVIQRAVAAYR